MANLYTEQSKNIRRTWGLMTTFFIVVILFGYVLSFATGNSLFVYMGVAISFFMNITSYWFSDSIAISMAGAVPAEKKDYPDLFATVENLSKIAGIPVPKIFIVDDPAPNAFATGRNPKHASIAVTTGILPLLNKAELEGVIAHELSHVANRDTLVSTVAVVLAGVVALISDFFVRMSLWGGGNKEKSIGIFVLGFFASLLAPLAASLIQLAISRKREFLADASGALLTRYPEGLASALSKISKYTQPMLRANNATAHLFIANPMGHALTENEEEKTSFIASLFMTHPQTKDRIEALLGKK